VFVVPIEPFIRSAAWSAISGRYIRNVTRKNFGKCSMYNPKARRINAPVPSELARNALAKPAAVAGREAGSFASADITTAAIFLGVLRRFCFSGGGGASIWRRITYPAAPVKGHSPASI